jgi:acyl-coenzyme A thioesterase PaaI-like protein
VSRSVLAHPPPDHVLRELGLEVDQRADGTLRGHLPLTDAVRAPSGEPLLGVVATMVDMMGGIASLRACTPDRVATADMSLHLLPTGGTDRLDGTMHIRRRGRRTLVVEVELHDAARRPAGLATLTFAVLPQPPGAPVLPGIELGRRPAIDAAGVGERPITEALGLRTVGPGVVEIGVAPQVRNSLGALNGGFLTATIDVAAASCASAAMGRPAETVDPQVAFLELGRVGPVRATATLVGPGSAAASGGRATVEVEVVDTGAGDEVLTRATAVVTAS